MINSISLSIETGGMTVLNLGYLRFVEILIPEITNGPTSPWLILGHHYETLSRTR